MLWHGSLENTEDLAGVHSTPARYTAGFAIGIIAVDLIYPKLPGNVANATTYPFPVLYKKVTFEIEQLFAGDDSIRETIINAAKELEQQGVRAIIGACGYFAHFQKDVADAVDVPVFLSSLCQLPMIKTGLSSGKSIAVLAASGDDIDEEMLAKVGTDKERIVIVNIGELGSFAAIRHGWTELDNGKLINELQLVVKGLLRERDDIGAILLECSDLPPYARALQAVSSLPIFDFNTMIDMVYHAVVQRQYFGYF